jgi:hypothetical protein
MAKKKRKTTPLAKLLKLDAAAISADKDTSGRSTTSQSISEIYTGKETAASQQLLSMATAAIRSRPSDDQMMLLLDKLNVIVPALLKFASQQAIFVKIRKVIREVYGATHKLTHAASTIMRVDQEIWNKRHDAYLKSVAASNAARTEYSSADIDAALDKWKNADDVGSMAAAIELSTGARLNEIVAASKFTK